MNFFKSVAWSLELCAMLISVATQKLDILKRSIKSDTLGDSFFFDAFSHPKDANSDGIWILYIMLNSINDNCAPSRSGENLAKKF
jgi:hypothetical protein